jgi:hypothetical protein
MRNKFKTFFEATDIFGFEADRNPSEKGSDDLLERPIKMFNIDLMMELLSHKTIDAEQPHSNFITEMQWGVHPGCVKLEIDTGYTFYIKKLGIDLQGKPIWATKRMFQLNRQGYGGLEDAVAHEVYGELEKAYKSPAVTTQHEYKDLQNLVVHVTNKVKRTARDIFIFEGIRKVDDNTFLIKMGVRAHGVQSPWGTRIEENLIQMHYDEKTGIIDVKNYNVESPVGGPHSWELTPAMLNIQFFPNQDREEISECLAVHMKYY